MCVSGASREIDSLESNRGSRVCEVAQDRHDHGTVRFECVIVGPAELEHRRVRNDHVDRDRIGCSLVVRRHRRQRIDAGQNVGPVQAIRRIADNAQEVRAIIKRDLRDRAVEVVGVSQQRDRCGRLFFTNWLLALILRFPAATLYLKRVSKSR